MNNLFDCYDEDSKGMLDFKSFLCCLSVLYYGTLDEKVNLSVYMNDNNQKGYL